MFAPCCHVKEFLPCSLTFLPLMFWTLLLLRRRRVAEGDGGGKEHCSTASPTCLGRSQMLGRSVTSSLCPGKLTPAS